MEIRPDLRVLVSGRPVGGLVGLLVELRGITPGQAARELARAAAER